jgi:hypothetical protein
VLLIRRTVRPRGYASGFDSSAALLNGLFEQPAQIESVLPFLPQEEIVRLSFPARIGRAPFHRARSASKKDSLTVSALHSSLALISVIAV